MGTRRRHLSPQDTAPRGGGRRRREGDAATGRRRARAEALGPVALSFDVEHPDRPTWRPDNLVDILEVLESFDTRATFFLQGRWVEAHPEAAARIAGAGHLVANHSHYHADLRLLSDAGIEADARLAGAAIAEATGIDPRPWYRCPFGAGADDARVVEALARAGYRHVGWDLAVRDWAPGRSARAVAREVVAGAGAHSVVLLHAWPAATVGALGGIIVGLRRRGAHLLALDALADSAGLPAAAPTRPGGIDDDR